MSETNICQVCKKQFSMEELFPVELIRPSLLKAAKRKFNGWNDEGYICLNDLRKLRSHRIEEILKEDHGEISKLDEMVIESLQEQDIIAENVNKKYERGLKFSERLSDRIAQFGGSWTFILSFFSVILIWMIINTILFIENPFDPYPFILLNLFLSCLAAIQAPIIMMSQNRQAAKDRLKNDDDYCTNLKAELEVRHLNAKLDQFMKNQWERLIELQQMQIDLAEDVLQYENNHRLRKEDTSDEDK